MGFQFEPDEDAHGSSERGGAGMRAVPAHSDDAGAHSGGSPRVVTTGGKILPHEAGPVPKVPTGLDLDTGEPVEVFMGGRGVQVLRHVVPLPTAPAYAAKVDALAFTVASPTEFQPWRWLIEEMRPLLPIEDLEGGKGWNGFKESLRFGGNAGVIAWGGKSQRGRVYFSIQGKGCGLVRDWHAMAEWLIARGARLKRVDLAHDDMEGAVVNVAWARHQYDAKGFNAGGRQPKHGLHGDWLSGEGSVHGRTLDIGNRKSGKMCRVYEKGKQLGDPTSKWTRVEVEWHGKDRVIPFDILTRPGGYLAGAYPCLAFLDAEQSPIRTVANAAQIAYTAAVEHAKQQMGKLVNLMLEVNGGDYREVVDQLRRDGLPERISPYSYQLRQNPCLLDRVQPSAPGPEDFAQ